MSVVGFFTENGKRKPITVRRASEGRRTASRREAAIDELKEEVARLVSGKLRDEDVERVVTKYPKPLSRVMLILARLEIEIDRLGLSKVRKGEPWEARLAKIERLKRERDYYTRILEDLGKRRRKV